MNIHAALDEAILLAHKHEQRHLATLQHLRRHLPASVRPQALAELADDLLEAHEETGISLDAWVAAREFVEAYHGPLVENGA